jgi:predicted dehydrogenase
MQVNKRKIRIGLIGLGQMGRNHLRVLSLLKGVEIQFIHDLDYANSKEMAQVFDVPAIENVNGVWPSVDAAIICSPTSTHSSMLRIASKHVSNIFVEKPLSYSLESTKSDVEYIKKNNLSIQVGFIERLTQLFRK